MKSKPYFPMFVDISNKNILVVGGGNIATRRVKTLLMFTRNIVVVAPSLGAEMAELAKAGQISLQNRPVKKSDFNNIYMVIAATNDRKLNDDIYRLCKDEGIYVNVSSDRDKCDFYFPGVFLQDELVVGVTASGLNHKKAKILRQEIQGALEKVSVDEDDDE